MLNNASRCVWEPAEMRTGFPAGSLNLFFPPWSLAVSASECRGINLLSPAVRVRQWGLVRLGAVSCVCVCVLVTIHACAYNCSALSVIIHFNGRKLCGKIDPAAAGCPCKSQINMECEAFMLQLTADGSIPKMHRDTERLLEITIHYYSIRIRRETLADAESHAAPAGLFQLLGRL